jgi:hypothetical protein
MSKTTTTSPPEHMLKVLDGIYSVTRPDGNSVLVVANDERSALKKFNGVAKRVPELGWKTVRSGRVREIRAIA